MVGCTEPGTAALNTVTIKVDKGVKEKLKLLIDTGAQLSLCKYSSIKEGSVYDPRKVANVRGISSGAERTLCETEIGLNTEDHETTHIFHVVGDGIRISYDGILGEDFFISKRARIDYKKRENLMGYVKLKFDDKVLSDERVRAGSIVLKARCETVVKVPTYLVSVRFFLLRILRVSWCPLDRLPARRKVSLVVGLPP